MTHSNRQEIRARGEAQRTALCDLLERRLATPRDQYIPMEEAFERLYRELGIERRPSSGFAERQPAEYGERRSVGPQDPGTELRSAEPA